MLFACSAMEQVPSPTASATPEATGEPAETGGLAHTILRFEFPCEPAVAQLSPQLYGNLGG